MKFLVTKMKKLLLVLVLIGLVAIPVALATQCVQSSELAKETLQARYAFADYRAEKISLGMEAAINYFDDAGNDTSTLEDLMSTFNDERDSLNQAADDADKDTFDATISDMKDTVKDFKNEINDLADDDEDILGEVTDAIDSKLDDNGNDLSDMLQGAYQNGKSYMLGKFEAAFCVAENAIAKLKDKDVDVSDAETMLTGIKEKEIDLSSKFEQAVLSCDTVSYGKCDTDEKQAYEDAKAELTSEYKDLKDALKIAREDKNAENQANDEGANENASDTNETEEGE
jgi:hypothetical protein